MGLVSSGSVALEIEPEDTRSEQLVKSPKSQHRQGGVCHRREWKISSSTRVGGSHFVCDEGLHHLVGAIVPNLTPAAPWYHEACP